MPLFCNDIDLLLYETGPFLDSSFAGQRLLLTSTATLTGTTLVLDSGSWNTAGIGPGMAAYIVTADGLTSGVFEIAAIVDSVTATVTVPRSRSADTPVAPAFSGSVKVTVTSFRPQIAAVGDELLAAVGVASDRDTATPLPASSNLENFRRAAALGTLATLYRTMITGTSATTTVSLGSGQSAVVDPVVSKFTYYQALYLAAKKAIAALVDLDCDGTPETRVRAGVGTLERA